MFARALIGRPARVLTALLIVLSASGPPECVESQERLSTGSRAAETPEQVAQQLIAALRSKDWTGMARLMHPAALAELRSLFDILLESEEADKAALRNQLFGVESAAEAQSLSDAVIFANLMRTVMAQQDGLDDLLATAEIKVLGHVQEGTDTVHVVFRMGMTIEEISISMMDVASLTRYDNTWRGLLKGDLRALAAGMRQAMLKKT